MTQMTDTPWRQRGQRLAMAATDEELRAAFVIAVGTHPGLVLDDVLYVVDLPPVRVNRERVKRLLDELVTTQLLERVLDQNETPPDWRYWPSGARPQSLGARMPLRPGSVARPPSVQEIMQEPAQNARQTPAALAASALQPRGIVNAVLPKTEGSAETHRALVSAGPEQTRAPQPPVKADTTPVVLRPNSAAVLAHVTRHPGVSFADGALDIGEGAGKHLTVLWAEGRLQRAGQRGAYKYNVAGPGEPPAVAPIPDERVERPQPKREPKLTTPKEGKPHPSKGKKLGPRKSAFAAAKKRAQQENDELDEAVARLRAAHAEVAAALQHLNEVARAGSVDA